MNNTRSHSELEDRREKRRRSVNWGGFLPVVLSLLLLVVFAATPGGDQASGLQKMQPALQTLALERPQETVAVIVQKAGNRNVEATVRRLGGTVTRDLSFINGFVAELPAGQAPSLAAARGVRHVSLDAPMVSTGRSDRTILNMGDAFDNVAYDNNDGLVPWETPWQEMGEADGPTNGFVRVGRFPRCVRHGCLLMGATDDAGYSIGGHGVSREADLSEARRAMLRFEYARYSRRHADNSLNVTLSVSADGGATWADLAVYEVADGSRRRTRERFDITPYISADTQIRFVVSGDVPEGQRSVLLIDNVAIVYETLPRSVFAEAVGADRLWDERPPVDGRGVTVAIVDSGVANHGDLENGENGSSRVAAEVNILNGAAAAEDDYGHGTHIAGIIAGNDKGRKAGYSGVAPKARVVDVKAIDETGAGTMSAVVEALHWIYEHKDEYDIRVVNLSLNSTVAESYQDSPLTAALEILWLNDVVVVVSVGNNGSSEPGVLYPPANDPYLIVVGAVDDQRTAEIGDDALTSYTAYGITAEGVAKPDLVAPGNNIISLLADDGSNLAQNHPDSVVLNEEAGGYFSMSGTSLSSAVVAGAVAQLLQVEPDLTPDQVKHRLMHTARTDWAGYDPQRAGAGYLDIYAAAHISTTERANVDAIPHNLLAKMALIAYWSSANGGDSIDWSTVDWASVNWASVNWASVNWASVNWASVEWDEVQWDEVNWASVNWASVNWASVNWASVNWASVNWASVNWASVNWAGAYWEE